jgi:hypothetical protein
LVVSLEVPELPVLDPLRSSRALPPYAPPVLLVPAPLPDELEPWYVPLLPVLPPVEFVLECFLCFFLPCVDVLSESDEFMPPLAVLPDEPPYPELVPALPDELPVLSELDEDPDEPVPDVPDVVPELEPEPEPDDCAKPIEATDSAESEQSSAVRRRACRDGERWFEVFMTRQRYAVREGRKWGPPPHLIPGALPAEAPARAGPASSRGYTPDAARARPPWPCPGGRLSGHRRLRRSRVAGCV